MKRYVLILLLFVVSLSVRSQTTFNIELQAYPTGLIPGFRIENQLNEKIKAHLRVGLNIFDHRDLGVQLNESGQGYGFTLGATRSLKNPKFEIGLRNDIWFNTVEWCDITAPSKITRETKITVLQPTAELSYRLEGKYLVLRPSVAFGLEWNVKTTGEPTGEGPILLFGLIVSRNKS